MVDDAQIKNVLKTVNDPLTGGNLLDQNRISGLHVKDNHIQLSLDIVDKANQDKFLPVKQALEEQLGKLQDVMSVTILFTAEKQNSSKTAPQQRQESEEKAKQPTGLDKVKKVIAVASGKGGVGKSTTAINLAFALQDQGLKVGLLDADIYGPSLPRMLGKNEQPRTNDNKTIIPIEVHGLKTMSIGFVIGEEEPIIWRGPMVMGALQQMLKDVIWGELDVLVVDMPPGTGDAQLTLSQQVPLAGAVIVSTPQDIALIDARKGLNMFKKTDVPVLGIVENMAHFICPHCGGESHIFGHEGAKREAEKLGVPFLGAIPLELAIREASDQGHAVVLDARIKKNDENANAHALPYLNIATKIATALFQNSQGKAKPKIIME